ncbi:hypothetical protein [Sphingosinicella sp. YJ22]|uniref:hypothetical protein n=1 Tax=Sphingosinicella sp. YJ22 TaxID=1104780 RepID=UPI00140903AB|nr:hypothetical protein [Sphingosinicella sp. YJ22]
MRTLLIAAAGLAAVMLPTAASAQGRYYPQPPYAYGHYDRDVAREMRECRRELRRADSRREYRRELRECRREIARAQRNNRYDDRYHRYDRRDRYDRYDRRGRRW